METHEIKNDEGWSAIIVNVLMIVAVSLLTVLAYNQLFSSASKHSVQNGGQAVLILSMQDWIKARPEGASTEEINLHFSKARAAALRASEAGYVVFNESQTVAVPEAYRLVPGMFPDPLEGEGK